jgi:RND family efflux transporter MFP subunit
VTRKNILNWGRLASKPLLLLIVAGGLLYWLQFRSTTVITYKVATGKIVNTVMGTGVLDAKNKTIISSKISGRISRILVDQGDKVKTGQLIVTLDDEELLMQVKVAQANVGATKSTVKKLKYELDYTKAVLINAEKVHKRQLKLIQNNIISQSVLDKSIEDFNIATANFNRAKSAIIEAEKKLLESKKMVELRQSQLRYTQIRAPFDGIIVFRAMDPGDIVVPGSSIMSLISLRILWVKSWVGETELENIRSGLPAKIVFRSLPNKKFPGKVVRLAREVDKETREFIVDVSVNKLPVNWASGQRAEVYIETAEKNNILIISEDFLQWRNNQPGVFVLQQTRAIWQTVELGLKGEGNIEVISGLAAGNIILKTVNPKKQLTNNCRVSVQ